MEILVAPWIHERATFVTKNRMTFMSAMAHSRMAARKDTRAMGKARSLDASVVLFAIAASKRTALQGLKTTGIGTAPHAWTA
jgi:hypothetical protein